MGNYASFSKKQFEYFLIKIRQKNSGQLGYWNDITANLENETKQSYWENVYMFQTKNPSLVILIYSSVDRRTERTREKGSDAVRIIYRLDRGGGGLWYKKVKKCYRVNSLETNLETALKNASTNVFNINPTGWYKEINKVED